MSRPTRVVALVTSTALLGLCATAAHAGQPFPTPGLYRVDIIGTRSASAAGQTTSQSLRTDGASGAATQRQEANGSVIAQRTVPGSGPVTQCIRPVDAGAPADGYARLAGAGCKPTRAPTIDGDEAVITIECPTLTQEVRSRRIDENRWEWKVDMMQTPGGGPVVPTVPAANAAVLAPMIEQLEARLRRNPPEAEAAAIRQHLASLRGGGAGRQVRQQATILYTRIAERCP